MSIKNINEILDQLVAIKLLEVDQQEEEINKFREEHGEVTPFVLFARHVAQYRTLIGNTFCVTDLHPLLQTVLQIYQVVHSANPVHMPLGFKWGLLYELLNHESEIKEQIQKLADGFDSNYLTLLQDAIDTVCGSGTSQRLGF